MTAAVLASFSGWQPERPAESLLAALQHCQTQRVVDPRMPEEVVRAAVLRWRALLDAPTLARLSALLDVLHSVHAVFLPAVLTRHVSHRRAAAAARGDEGETAARAVDAVLQQAVSRAATAELYKSVPGADLSALLRVVDDAVVYVCQVAAVQTYRRFGGHAPHMHRGDGERALADARAARQGKPRPKAAATASTSASTSAYSHTSSPASIANTSSRAAPHVVTRADESIAARFQALTRKGQVEDAADVLDEMIGSGHPVSRVIFESLIHACCRNRPKTKVKVAMRVLSRMTSVGLTADVAAYGAILDLLALRGNHEAVRALIDEMSERGVEFGDRIYNKLLQACGTASPQMRGLAVQTLRKMQYRDRFVEMNCARFRPPIDCSHMPSKPGKK